MKRVHDLVESESEDEYEPGSVKSTRQSDDQSINHSSKRIKWDASGSQSNTNPPSCLTISVKPVDKHHHHSACQSPECVHDRHVNAQQTREIYRLQRLTQTLQDRNAALMRKYENTKANLHDQADHLTKRLQLAEQKLSASSQEMAISAQSSTTTNQPLHDVVHVPTRLFVCPNTCTSPSSKISPVSSIQRSIAGMRLDFTDQTGQHVLTNWLQQQTRLQDIPDIMRAMKLFPLSEVAQLKCLDALLQFSMIKDNNKLVAQSILDANGVNLINVVLQTHQSCAHLVGRCLDLLIYLIKQSVCQHIQPITCQRLIETGLVHALSGPIVSMIMYLLDSVRATSESDNSDWLTSDAYARLIDVHTQLRPII